MDLYGALFKACVSHEKNCCRMQTRISDQALIIPFFFFFFFAFLWSKGFSVFWSSQKQSYRFQLHLNTTALCRNAASGTQMISTCAQVFPAYFSNAKHPADMGGICTGCRKRRAMRSLIYKRIHSIKDCDPPTYFVSQAYLTFRGGY